MITITWWDGSITTGADWEAAEHRLRSAQWIEYPSKAAFRRDMRHRAKTWSGNYPNLPKMSSEQFLRALEAEGMCRVDNDNEE